MGELANLNQIVAEIKFFENQAVVSYWEIGKRLSQAKGQVGHGEWIPWIEENLNYTRQTASSLIRVYESYPNGNTSLHLNFSKVLALTSIKDEEERQDFIDSHEVEDMTTRELQAEIKEYKESLKAKEEELNEINSCYNSLSIVAKNREEENERLREDLRQEREKPAEVVEKEVVPEDYEDLKSELKELMDYQRELENKLYEEQQKPKEVVKEVEPKDYKFLKSENERLEGKLQKEIAKNLSLINEKKLVLSQLETEKAHEERVKKIRNMQNSVDGFIVSHGGLLFTSEYLEEVTPRERNLYLDAVKNLRAFSEQLYLNCEEAIKKYRS